MKGAGADGKELDQMKKGAYLSDNAWLDFNQMLKASQGRKIIFWGCFDWFEKTTRKCSFDISHLVDTSTDVQGSKIHHGYDVLDPSTLKGIKDKKRYYVIITTSAFYDVIDQMMSYGYEPGSDFCVSPLLKNFKVIEDIRSKEVEILFSSNDGPNINPDKGGGLYLYKTKNFQLEKKVSGVVRGFTEQDGKYFMVDALTGIQILDSDFKQLDILTLPKQSYPHGILTDKENNLLYVVLARRDEIQAYDLKSLKPVRTITLSDKFRNTGQYAHHMNDIWLDGESLYISMFSYTGNVQKNYFDGVIAEYDLKSDRMIGPLAYDLWQPHTVKIINQSLCFLDSMRGNLHTTSQKIESHFNGFVRGLDYDGYYYYVGLSVHRYFDRMQGTSNNISVDCGIYILDSESKACRFLPMKYITDINTLALYKS